MFREPDLERPYIELCQDEDRYEVVRERVLNSMWQELSEDVLDGELADYEYHKEVASHLLRKIACFYLDEEKHMHNLALSPQIRKSQRDVERVLFVSELYRTIETLLDAYIETNIARGTK